MEITRVIAREVLDSRGNPTVEVEVWAGKVFGRAIAPSGASTGTHEAVELRDGGKRYHGKGVLKAVNNVNTEIASLLVGMDVEDQRSIDDEMIRLDGTKNKSRLGANAIVATSMAVLKCAAASQGKNVFEYMGGKELPLPMFNILNGGKHAGNNLSIQEFMIRPKGKTFADTLRMSSEIYHELKEILLKKYGKGAINVGDEGGFAPPLSNTAEALDLLISAVDSAGYSKETTLAMDAAASEFYKNGKYFIDGKSLSGKELKEYYLNLFDQYPISSLEDPFYEEDFSSFAELTNSTNIQIVGDDLLVTNPDRIKKAISKNSCNALLLKVNQIGTVSEAIEASNIAKSSGWKVIVSHRSGESEDAFIADFAVGIDAGQIKTGAPARGERTAKYNQLLRIEERGGKWSF